MFKNKLYSFVAALLAFSLVLPSIASATQLNQASIHLGRLGISASSNNDALVTFKLRTAPTTIAKISVFFPSGFTLAAGTPTVSTTGFPNTPAGISVPPGSLTATVTSSGAGAGGTIVVSGLTSASLNSSSLYGFTIPTGTITNPATANQYNNTVSSLTSADAVVDTTLTPTYIYGLSPDQDKVTVSASVAPNFSFALSANGDTVPLVDSSNIQTSPGVTMTVGTNSPLGYTAYVRSANGSLTSATSPATPITTGTFNGTADSVLAGTTKYGFLPTTGTACSSCTGSLTYDAEYSSGSGNPISAGNQAGAFNTTNFASFVSRSGYTSADQITLKERIAVANTVGYANDYTDTLTIVAAGNF
ncbi:MAG: hypothetical protein JWO35_698 [Candidatus Saccharibacteria bacterium]|nr:hypothetical protein [Candidatus Saccharibacteria bacterium]